MNCDSSKHEIYIIFNESENSILLVESKSKVIGNSHLSSPLNII